jgi:hypothetical protein
LEGPELTALYSECEAANYDLHAEQRSNLLLIGGKHYSQKEQYQRKINKIEKLTKEQKIRLTKNHTQKITKTYRNAILNYAPGVAPKPKNREEIQDQKAADMHGSVWTDMKQELNYPTKKRELVQDYIDLGEMCLVVKYDYDRGGFLYYEDDIDPETGDLRRDDDGAPKPRPVFAGQIVWERILGFNMLTPPNARSWEESEYVIIRKMMARATVEHMVRHDPDRIAEINSGNEGTWKVFDANQGGYEENDKLVMLKEFYFRPCVKYPKGYYYITCGDCILFEGELPLGLFPVLYCGFDELATSPRSSSVIRVVRPMQAELNRAASTIAQHQITMGWDKIVVTNNGKVSPGATAHGVKTIRLNTGDIKHLPGRTGEQYLNYMQSQISEMYQAANLVEETAEKPTAQYDPLTMLYVGIKDKKRFTLYAEKVIEFDKQWCIMSLRLAKAFYPDERLIPAIGKREIVNIPEFRAADDLGYQIVAEEQREDVESQLGRHLTLGHILQYVGNKLDTKDLGQLIRAFSTYNDEEALDGFTLDYDCIKNDLLKMDRGQYVPAQRHEDHVYILRMLGRRIKAPDFEVLDPQIQQMYHKKLAEHEQFIQMQLQAEQMATAGFVPSGGMLVTISNYRIPDPNNPGKVTTLRLPAESINWLVQKLSSQGSTQEMVQQLGDGQIVDIAERQGLPPGQAGNIAYQ